jgi:hypothetical protein
MGSNQAIKSDKLQIMMHEEITSICMHNQSENLFREFLCFYKSKFEIFMPKIWGVT